MNALSPDSSDGVAAWIQTRSGIAFDLLAPTPMMVDFGDIAWALARIPRFLGHTTSLCTVASHSIMVRDITLRLARHSGLPRSRYRELALAALLHDAHEAYIGDFISPVMALPGLREAIRPVKLRIQAVIHRRFKLPVELPEEFYRLIHMADLTALATEKRDLLGTCARPWLDLPPAEYGVTADRQVTFESFLQELYALAYPGTPPAANDPPAAFGEVQA